MGTRKSPDKSVGHPIEVPLKQVVHRYKQRNFVIDASAHVLEGKPLDDALIEAVQENFIPNQNGQFGDQTALAKAHTLLQKPHIMAGMTLLFEHAGLSPAGAAKTHVDHIKGLEYEGYDKEGNAVTVKLPPNYQALADYWKLTTPRPATKVEVRSASVMEVIDRPSDAPMAARSLKRVEIEQGE